MMSVDGFEGEKGGIETATIPIHNPSGDGAINVRFKGNCGCSAILDLNFLGLAVTKIIQRKFWRYRIFARSQLFNQKLACLICQCRDGHVLWTADSNLHIS